MTRMKPSADRYTPRHYPHPTSTEARARVDADRAVLLLAATDPHNLFDALLAAGALPLGES